MGSYSCCVGSKKQSRPLLLLSRFLKIIAEKNRLKLIYILHQGGHCVCEIMNHEKMSQSLISHHLKDLKDTGLVSVEKRGLRVYYSLTAKGKKIADLLLQIATKGVEL